MSVAHEVNTLRRAAGALARPEVLTLKVQGSDRVRYLNGMLSNDVSTLVPGRGLLAVKPTPRGRVEGVVRVRALEDAFLLDLRSNVAEQVAASLLKLIVMDDVTLSDESDGREVLAVYGPESIRVLERAGFGGSIETIPDLGFVVRDAATLVRDDGLGIPGFEVHVPVGRAGAVIHDLEAAGASQVSGEAIEVVRIEAGVPIEGKDIDGDTIPMEARLERAISFTKGCYVGQEVIARATNLGQIKHILVGLILEADEVPPRGAQLWPDGDKQTGAITSAIRSPTLERVIALGYVRKVHDAPGMKVAVRWDGRETSAVVTALPFVR